MRIVTGTYEGVIFGWESKGADDSDDACPVAGADGDGANGDGA